MADADAGRRLAAILSGDIVGYSRLIAHDEEATVATLRLWRELVAECATRHRGRVADFTGDNFLAEFPAARNAVECGLEIQRLVEERNTALPDARRMRFRIGAHLGDVLSEEGRIYGDGVNVAARLEPLAAPGGLCLSAAVVEQVRGKLALDYQDLGEQALKNIATPVRAYRAYPEGTRAPSAPTPVSPLAARRRSRIAWAQLALTALGLSAGAITWWWQHEHPDARALESHAAVEETPSVAVLPFESFSANPDDAFLAPGLAAAVQHQLASRLGVTVIASTSSFEIKESEHDVRAIGRRLGARYLVTGTVLRAGDRMRATTRLIDSRNGDQVWSLSFDRTLADIFAVEDEISARVAEGLSLTVAGEHALRPPAQPRNLEAHLAYLQGKGLLARWRLADSRQAIERFARAVELGPNDAEALVGEAEAIVRAALLARESESEAWKRAGPLVERALALDPNLGEAYVLRATRNGDEVEFRKGLALAPNYGPGYSEFADFLFHETGRTGDALRAADRARQLDPLTPRAHYLKALLVWNTAPNEAERLFRQALDVDPEFAPALARLAQLAAWRGHFALAAHRIEQAIALDPSSPWIRDTAAAIYVALGDARAAHDVVGTPLRPSAAALAVLLFERDDKQRSALLAELDQEDANADIEFVAFAVRATALETRDFPGALRRLAELAPPDSKAGAKPFLELDLELVQAHLLKLSGQPDLASEHIERVLRWIERDAPRLTPAFSFQRERAVALALRGDGDEAIRALEAHYASGFSPESWYALEYDPAFSAIRGAPRFQALVAALRAHRASERAELERMRARGEVPFRPAKRAEQIPATHQ